VVATAKQMLENQQNGHCAVNQSDSSMLLDAVTKRCSGAAVAVNSNMSMTTHPHDYMLPVQRCYM
jgi:hypothetical protein